MQALHLTIEFRPAFAGQEAKTGARPAQDDREHAVADSRRLKACIAETIALRNAPGGDHAYPDGARWTPSGHESATQDTDRAVRASGVRLEWGPKGAGGATKSPRNVTGGRTGLPWLKGRGACPAPPLDVVDVGQLAAKDSIRSFKRKTLEFISDETG